MTARRKISPEELGEILAEHEKWLTSDGKEGSRASLHDADLSRLALAGVNLRQADLRNADLGAADLSGASLEASGTHSCMPPI